MQTMGQDMFATCTRAEWQALRGRTVSVQENDSCDHFVLITLKHFTAG